MEEELRSKQEAINLKLAGAIRSMEEMKQTGNNVNVELHRQDQVLDRIDQKLDAVENETKQSKKLLSSIGSFWGFIKNRITGWKYQPTELPTSKEAEQPVQSGKPQTGQLNLQQQEASQEDRLLSELLNQTKQVRSIVSTTNQTLTAQGKKIDVIGGKVDRNINNIAALDRECRRILN